MYKFEPILKTLVWGTENWVLSGVPGNESVVTEGPDKGRKITDIYPGQFPLLIKFIDARKDLSIQVHPNDELAQKRHGCKGKTEMWYIIDAAEGARLFSGLKEKIDADEYVRLVEKGEITSVLAEHKVAPGDVFFLPAGRIHAIGGGCYLAEIQQTSDITYRIYDYGRLGLDGKPRQLHTELAKDAIDYTVYPDYRTRYESKPGEENELVRCPYFVTSLYELDSPVDKTLSGCGDFLIVMCLEGSATLFVPGSCHDGVCTLGQTLSIGPGECVLLPASDRFVSIEPDGKAKLLATHC